MKSVKDRRKGVAPDKRKKSLTAKGSNQHVSDPRQEMFLDLYLLPESPTFGNAYQSAITAGYSDGTARQILSPTTNNKWIFENPRLRNLTHEHLTGLTDNIAVNSRNEATQLKAIELSAKLKGLMIERKEERKEVISVSLDLSTPVNQVIEVDPNQS